MENENKKKCTKCCELKDFNCFNKYYNGKHGLQAYCKECFHKYSCIDNRDKILEYSKKYRREVYYPRNQNRLIEYGKRYSKGLPNIKCNCGKEIKSSYYSKHLNTSYHKRHINENKENIPPSE